MIRPVTLYEGICDGCGKQLEYDGGAITAWGDAFGVSELMQDSGWLGIKVQHYCPDCYEYNDELDEYVPKYIYKNDVIGNPLMKGAKVLYREHAFDTGHIWRLGIFKGETKHKYLPYTIIVDGEDVECSACLAYNDSTKKLEGYCTQYISKQWQLRAAIKYIEELNGK